mmetsp:Transcript_5662/g.14140  ORF Transcript_5662/g.14140 Transcript_5662/m.14140 type:complete len:228 (-) Transcript_5662:802-1485(-)
MGTLRDRCRRNTRDLRGICVGRKHPDAEFFPPKPDALQPQSETRKDDRTALRHPRKQNANPVVRQRGSRADGSLPRIRTAQRYTERLVGTGHASRRRRDPGGHGRGAHEGLLARDPDLRRHRRDRLRLASMPTGQDGSSHGDAGLRRIPGMCHGRTHGVPSLRLRGTMPRGNRRRDHPPALSEGRMGRSATGVGSVGLGRVQGVQSVVQRRRFSGNGRCPKHQPAHG